MSSLRAMAIWSVTFVLSSCVCVETGSDSGGTDAADGTDALAMGSDGSPGTDGGGMGNDAGGAGTDSGIPAVLPPIDNYSTASPMRTAELVGEAIAGLGFPASSVEGPNVDDRFFVGLYYIAWIDQTGFYGKMNGLWRLNAAPGDALDFVVRDTGGRPVNFFVVGEDGDGAWAAGYPGAEHIEFPNTTPEPNDDPGCGAGSWCNQYALNEAAQITDPDIPWWSACNAGTPAWTAIFSPVAEQNLGNGLKLVYEGPLVKEADGDGTWDGDECHQDYLFGDGVRRTVYLRVGYELFGDLDYFDRTMELRNPAGNPPFDGPMSLIGGFVVTDWPSPHPLKALNRFLRPESTNVSDPSHGITLLAGQWNDHDLPPPAGDEVFAWLDQPISLSVSNVYVAGRSATLAHVGPSDNADVGICLCSVHGGLEMGGGLIHGGVSLPISGGSTTIEARRRLTLPGDATITVHTYEAETAALSHEIGQVEPDGWSASPASDAAGHLSYGPYATDWGGVSAAAVFFLMVDDNSLDNAMVVTLDIYDVTTDQVLATRPIARMEFPMPSIYEGFDLSADLTGRAGHTMEARVYWHDVTYVRLDKIVVTTN